MFDNLFSLVSSIQIPSPQLVEVLVPCLKKECLPKKTLLLKVGDVCSRMYFVEKGFIRAFYSKGNREITSWFMQENEMIIAVSSFYNQKPSTENVELLEDAVLISISFADLQSLYERFPEFNLVGRVLTEKYYCLSEERLANMRMQTTREKYETLLLTYPEIFNRAPLKYIASYLGMKPETISRLRGEIHRYKNKKRVS